MEGEKVERKLGRPSNVDRAKSLPQFSGPSLDDVLTFNDAKVAEAFDALQVEPAPFNWNEEDDIFNYSLYNSDPLDEPNVNPSKELLATLHMKAKASYATSTRCELFHAMLTDWVNSLPHGELLKMLKVRGVQVSEVKVRYTALSDFQQQLVGFLWHEAVEASTSYPRQPQVSQPQQGRRSRHKASTMNG